MARELKLGLNLGYWGGGPPPGAPDAIAEAERLVAERQLPISSFEFQMLYGIRRDLQSRLVSKGYRVRVYIPYGKAWYPYFMRRLAERPANLLFLLRNLMR